MRNINEVEHNKCTGCKLCAAVCPTNAVSFYEDFLEEDGFWYPCVKSDKCILCGVCYEKCPAVQAVADTENKQICAAKSKDDNLRFHSTSGGMFSEFAKVILARGGSVAGAVYGDRFVVKHILTDREEDMERLRRSKYTQSDMNNIYSEVRDTLNKGEYVLFCGTPCQTAALKNSMDREYEKLYTLDFICRGVYSPIRYREYLDKLEQEHGGEVKSVWAKNKENGWHSLSMKIEFANGKVYMRPGLEDAFGKEYLIYNRGIRPSCFTCNFKGLRRCADITVGDFWGLDGTELDDDIGTSVVIIRTEKGQELFETVKSRCVWQPMTIEDVIRGNPCYEKSVERKLVERKP